jgi:hypothetical protein
MVPLHKESNAMGILPALKAGRIFLILSFLAMELLLFSFRATGSEEGAFPVAQRLVREGEFAVRLLSSISSISQEEESAAVKRLGDMGIVPRNGWIADYPVTPDIVGELRNTLIIAAVNDKLGLAKDKALERFEVLCASFNLPSKADPGNTDGVPAGAREGTHPTSDEIKRYYEAVGPPVVTYYPPPESYTDIYCMVPYSFRCRGIVFNGFYILKRFHLTVFNNSRVEFVSNTFHIFRDHREFLIDPIARLYGSTYAGIGARGKGFLPTGIKGSERRIFNGAQPWVRP